MESLSLSDTLLASSSLLVSTSDDQTDDLCGPWTVELLKQFAEAAEFSCVPSRNSGLQTNHFRQRDERFVSTREIQLVNNTKVLMHHACKSELNEFRAYRLLHMRVVELGTSVLLRTTPQGTVFFSGPMCADFWCSRQNHFAAWWCSTLLLCNHSLDLYTYDLVKMANNALVR